MSQIIVNIPDCAAFANNTTRDAQPSNNITIDTSNCPVAPPNPAPTISTFGIIIVGIVVIAFFVATAIVRHRAHELKPKRLEAQNAARKIELDARVAMANSPKCQVCGHKPVLEES